jgi:hypothetical protein
MKKLYILGLAVCGLAACKPNLDPDTPEKGNANFERYLAVGNSLTAGYADGSLYRSGQLNSYPAMLAEQFSLVGGGEFKQPLLPGNDGYPGAKRVLAYGRGLCDTFSSIIPILYPGAVDSAGSSKNIANEGPFNNTGIPGIRCIDYLFPGYGAFNPYSKRFFTSPATSRPIDEVVKVNPTFFTAWVGANDVLSYATNGGTESGAQISNDQMFYNAYDTIITKLTRTGAKGVVLNLPDITSIPYFTTVPPNALKLTFRQANDLNTAYNGSGIRFTEGYNYFVIQTPEGMRKIRPNEYVLLSVPQDSIKCAGWGSIKPIPGKYILTQNEIDSVKTAILDFNQSITIVANEHNVPIVDMYSYMQTIQGGIVYDGVNYNASFVTGSAFSLDGVHLTPRGYALVANQIIDIINNAYQSTLPHVNVNKYPGIKFPNK